MARKSASASGSIENLKSVRRRCRPENGGGRQERSEVKPEAEEGKSNWYRGLLAAGISGENCAWL
jgi:hypothetical protein